MKNVRRTAALALFAALLASVLPLTAGAATGPVGWRTVSYLRAVFVVPPRWPVRDLASEPTSCVRFDVHAVYLGHQGPDPACPARVIGRTEAVQAEPLDAASAAQFPFSPTATTVADLPAFVAPGSETSHAIVVAFPTMGVLVTLSYGADRALVRRILASVRDASGRIGLTAPVRLPVTP